MNNEIIFSCSKCEQKMLVDATAAGMSVACPSCGIDLHVPTPEAAPTVPSAPDPIIRPRNTSRPPIPSPARDITEPPTAPAPSAASATMTSALIEADVANLRQELIAASVQNSRLEGELTEVRQQLKKVRADLSHTISDRNELHAQAEALHGELEATRQELETAREEIVAWQRQNHVNQHQLQESETDLNSARQQLTDIQAERATVYRDMQTLEERIVSLDRDLAFARADLAAAAKVSQQLEATEIDLNQMQVRAKATDETIRQLESNVAELSADRDSLRRSLSESGLGKELITTREQLTVTTKERDLLQTQTRQLTNELHSAEAQRRERDDLIKQMRKEMEEARKIATASKEDKINQDNDVLRGIIERQNAQLEEKHVQLVRLQRARLGVQLAYAAFALALIGIVYWAVRVVPGLKLGKLLDF